MLTTWIDAKRNIQVVQRTYVGNDTPDTPDGMADLVEVEVTEDSTGNLTVYIRQCRDGLDPVAVKFVGPDMPASAALDEVAAQRER